MKHPAMLGVSVLAALALAAPGIAAVTGASTLEQQVRARFGPRHDDTALCLIHYEDGSRDPARVSRTHDHGLFQIHVDPWLQGRWVGVGRWRRYFPIGVLHTVAGNIRAALILSSGGSNFNPWTGTYGRGLCHGLT